MHPIISYLKFDKQVRIETSQKEPVGFVGDISNMMEK